MPRGLKACDGASADLTRSLNLSQPPMLPVLISLRGVEADRWLDLRGLAKWGSCKCFVAV